ncbi:hypothetical protein K4F52_002767 [Lecanicillium sp. MT-2017a]|nr:hypothetical protein K4F52_002767 [Lecanicillium sp. MT-2017a]
MSETKESPSATEIHVEHQDDVESGGSEKVVFEHDKLRSKIEGVNQTRFDTSSWSFRMTVLACSIALCASQIHPLLYLTLATAIARDLDAANLSFWLLTSPIIASSATAPFVGPLADLFGRKLIFIGGVTFVLIGCIVSAATPTGGGFVAGQALIGMGTVVEELLAIAIVGEIVPTAKRPIYAAGTLCMIIPWSPGSLYGNFITRESWRWVGMLLGMWNLLIIVLLVPFYHPPPRVNSSGLSRRQLLGRIDFVGGTAITIGILFLSMALNWGGQEYPWNDSRVIAFLTIGFAFIIGFFLWEWKGAKYPLYPRRIVYAPRPFFCMLFVIFAAGVNYIPLTAFWAIENIAMYNTNRTETGINTIPLGSACLTLADPNKIGTAMAPAVIAMIGIGGVLVPNQVIITVISPDELIGTVTALTLAVRAQAQVIGLAIFYNRFVHEVTKNSMKYLITPAFKVGWLDIKGITEMMTALTAVPFKEYAPLIPQLRDPENYQIMHEATVKVFTEAFKHVWFITIGWGVPAVIAALCLGDLSAYMDGHIAAPL